MRRALVIIAVTAFGLSNSSANPRNAMPALGAAVACSKASLKYRAVSSNDPPEALARAAFNQCMPLFQAVAEQATATPGSGARTTALARGIAYQIHMFGLFAGYMPLAARMVGSLRAASRS